MSARRHQPAATRRQPARRSRASSSIEPASQSDQPDASQTSQTARTSPDARQLETPQTAPLVEIVDSGQPQPEIRPSGAVSGQTLDVAGLGQLPESLVGVSPIERARRDIERARRDIWLNAADVETTRVDALVADPENRRLHNPRNVESIVASLRAVGTARSIVIDEDDVVLAGNGVREAAQAAGIENVRIIEADGDELIAVRRRGLTPEQKRLLAMYDNRTSELATWNVEQLQADNLAGLDLKPWFTPDELAKLVGPLKLPDATPLQPSLSADVRIEVLCSRDDLNDFMSTLETWQQRSTVTVQIA